MHKYDFNVFNSFSIGSLPDIMYFNFLNGDVGGGEVVVVGGSPPPAPLGVVVVVVGTILQCSILLVRYILIELKNETT